MIPVLAGALRRGAATLAALALTACGGGGRSSAKAPPAAVVAPTAPPVWAVPVGWKAETIPFPLGFAPGLAYRGVEELRFPPGFFTGTLAAGVSGTVEAFDAFEAEAPVSLHLEARAVTCAKAGLVALVFVASPRARGPGDVVWGDLDALVSGLRC